MPYVEHEMIEIIKNNNLEFVQLLAPTSTDQTITNCLANEPAMVYYITQRGVTGSGNLNYAEITENLKAIRNQINVPLVTGFGIKTTEHVKQFKNFTDGIVIGSSIVDILSKSNPITTLENYISPIIKEIKA
jgi:tryptophan synthase alpha chain